MRSANLQEGSCYYPALLGCYDGNRVVFDVRLAPYHTLLIDLILPLCATSEQNCNVDFSGPANSTTNVTHAAYGGNNTTSSILGIVLAFCLVLYAW